jgi:transposase
MHVVERSRGDRRKLAKMIDREKGAHQRDRLRAVALALDGRETLAIAGQLRRSRAFVQRWVYAYRDHGLDAVRARKAPGRRSSLSAAEQRAVVERVTAGAQPSDGVATLRAKEIRRIIKQVSGKAYSISGVYYLLHRLGFSCLQPRPRHPRNDPAAVRRFRRSAPLFSSA